MLSLGPLLDPDLPAARVRALADEAGVPVRQVPDPQVHPSLSAMFAYYDDHGLPVGTRVLAALLGAGFALALSVGQSLTPPLDVLRVLAGHDVPGASFTVGTLRLPRALLSILAGMSFGLGGAAFQIMLRNPLASPDVIGITSGASAAAAFALVFLGWDGTAVSVTAIVAALGVALLVYVLAFKDGVAGTRLVLVGIGIAALLASVIQFVMTRTSIQDAQAALVWLTGSLARATWPVITVLAVVLAAFRQRDRIDLDEPSGEAP